MRDRTVAIVWIGGVVLAASAYLVGPDRFLSGTAEVLAAAERNLAVILQHLGANTYDLIRALALGASACSSALA